MLGWFTGVLLRRGQNTRGMCLERKDHVSAQRESCCPEARRDATGEIKPLDTLILAF